MRAACDESDDSDLIEEIQRRILANGKLVSRRMTWCNGVGTGPSVYTLMHLGSAPELAPHEPIDIRNSIIQSGSACKNCGKLFAMNV